MTRSPRAVVGWTTRSPVRPDAAIQDDETRSPAHDLTGYRQSSRTSTRGANAPQRCVFRGSRPAGRAVQVALQAPAEQLLEPERDRRRAASNRPPCGRRRARAARRGPRSRCSRSRSERTGSRRDRRSTRRAPTRRRPAPPRRRRSRCCACCGGVRRPRGPRIDTRSTRRFTRFGVATPIVSASTSSSTPSKRSHSAATAPGSTSPSNGQPKEHDTVTVTGFSDAATIACTRRAASSSVALPFRSLNVSVAASVQLTRSSVVDANRSWPRSFSTSPESSALPLSAPATTCSASAICGTRSSRTNDTASMRGTPAAARRVTSVARVAWGSASGSFCSPSRGPTSQINTSTA